MRLLYIGVLGQDQAERNLRTANVVVAVHLPGSGLRATTSTDDSQVVFGSSGVMVDVGQVSGSISSRNGVNSTHTECVVTAIDQEDGSPSQLVQLQVATVRPAAKGIGVELVVSPQYDHTIAHALNLLELSELSLIAPSGN